MDFDTLIIGAGLSGLAAGVRLAHFGERVCIVERHVVPGGLNSFYRRSGMLLDSGLHAITNAGDAGNGLFYRLLRQLRISRRSLDLRPQRQTLVRFPHVDMLFSNDISDLRDSICAISPVDLAAFDALCDEARGFDPFRPHDCRGFAREVIRARFCDHRLVELLLCPVMSYGCPRPHDMDYQHFLVLFDGIFLQGLCRPARGISTLVEALAARFRAGGGELHLGTGVSALQSSGAEGPEAILDDGKRVSAGRVISSAGYPETMALLGDETGTGQAGELSVIESIFMVDTHPAELGVKESILFFNDSADFRYVRPKGLYDAAAGVVCLPANFEKGGGEPGPYTVRLTRLANYQPWLAMDDDTYAAEKARIADEQLSTIERFMPDVRRHVCGQDTFTPRTIERFTGHFNGALYGAPEKHFNGETPHPNVFICGADQGFPGIVGALLSGVTMANRFLRQGRAGAPS